MILRAGFLALAHKLQEASQAMSTDDVRTRLSDCLNDTFRGTGNWCYVVAVFGDDKSGDVIYSCNSDLKKAPYKIGKSGTAIETTAAVDVQPLTTYESESAEMLEAGRRNSGRDLKQLQSIHDASTALGAACGARESRGTLVGRETLNNSTLSLVESAITLETIVLREAKADYEIKLIAPGKGSSAFYPTEVLKRDGPSVFKEGTHVYLNHATRSEEAERPEGDVKNLAGVLSKGAYWVESHAKGPGLYGRMKVFADHAQIVEEKAAHVGMSIRANGEAVMEAGRPLLKEGLPTLSKLTSAESVDVVTRAGAGGMILTEAANPANPTQEAAMDAAELTKLQESIATANAAAATANAANAKLLERALKGDAREEATRILAGITLPESSKLRVIDTVLREALPKTEAGELDTVKFTEAVNLEAKREGVYVAGLTDSGHVIGMGTPGEVTPAREAEKPEEINARSVKIFERLGHSKEAAERAVKGRVA